LAQGQEAHGLDRLNASERQVLLLLAEGHTAKSVANLLGSTEAAVNERLREGRRKTGVGSSRELARLLKAQERRDEKLGPAGARRLYPPAALSEPEPWRPQIGVLAMMGFFFVVAAGATAMMQAPGVTSAVDPLLEEPLQRRVDTVDLHTKVRAEPRDPLWAPRAEEQIRSVALRIPLIGKGGNVLRVTCASTICEVAGKFATASSSQKIDDPTSPSSIAMRDLQGLLPENLAKIGLKSESGLFTGSKGKPDQMVFLIYYSRSA